MTLGTVISTFDGPSTNRFSFVVNSNALRKGEFVSLGEPNLIAVVNEVRRANRYFERAETISEYEKNGSVKKDFPAQDWEYVVADCAILGSFNGRSLSKNSFPPSPGEKVVAADNAVLKQFLGFEDNGLKIGKLMQHDVPVTPNLTRLLQKHLAILGISGSGKSVCATVVLEEVLSRKKEDGRIGVVVFDVHGEYSCFADKTNKDFANKTTVVNGEKIRIACHKLTPVMLSMIFPDLSSVQQRAFNSVLKELTKKMKDGAAAFTLDDVVAEINSSKMTQNVRDPLLSKIDELKQLRLFSQGSYPIVKDVVKSGKLTVFDLNAITSVKKKQIILAYFAQRLFNQRRKQKIPPFMLLVEEAHNFCREKASAENAVSKSIIETIAREGRKFGASLCLISQRPVQLSTTALSQCNSYIIMRITNPFDLKHIGESCEAIDSSVAGQISGLQVGEGILLGEAVNYPVFIKVRNRTTRKTRGGHSLEELGKQFEEITKEITPADVEGFI